MRHSITARIHAALTAARNSAVFAFIKKNLKQVKHFKQKHFPTVKEKMIVDRPLRTIGILFGVFLIATVAVLTAAWFRNDGNLGFVSVKNDNEVASSETDAVKFRRAIDGVPLEEADKPSRYIAITIDNIAEAMPQSGVAKAPLVYEAPVEGGLTRLLLIFPEDMGDIPKIGPVRSARPYFIDWAKEFDAIFTHVGGSPAALDILHKNPSRDLDEYYNSTNFWRDLARKAPHNVYTSSVLLEKAFGKLDGSAISIQPWIYKDEAVKEDNLEKVENIIPFAKLEFSWRYNEETNSYLRFNGKQEKDTDGTPVIAKNVVVIKTSMDILDDVGRRAVKTIGQGDADIYRDGSVIHGTWHKESVNSRTTFLDKNGEQIKFNAGTTWIEVAQE